MEKITLNHGQIKGDFITKGTIDRKTIFGLIDQLTEDDKKLIERSLRINGGVIDWLPVVGDCVQSKERAKLTEMKLRLNCSWRVFKRMVFDMVYYGIIND